VIGQYTQSWTDSLRDDGRTGAPILIVGQDGIPQRPILSNVFHVEALVSYRPVPGTIMLAATAAISIAAPHLPSEPGANRRCVLRQAQLLFRLH